jgi:hypothetical protein
MIEEINPGPMVQEILRALGPPVPPYPPDMDALLLAELLEARDATAEELRTGL